MRSIGIDPGANTGFAVVDLDGSDVTRSYSLVVHGLIVTKPTESDYERAYSVGEELVGVVDEYRPDVAVIEKPPSYTRGGCNVRSLMILAMLYGAALVAIPPSCRVVQWPAPTGKRGLVTKRRARLLCRTWFGPDVERKMSGHACDAAVLAVSGL